jgi:hypothetical protein
LRVTASGWLVVSCGRLPDLRGRRPPVLIAGPTVIAGPPPDMIRLPRPARTGDMTRVCIAGHPLTATAAPVWNGDLPRPLQQILFDTADGATPPNAPSPPTTAPPGRQFDAALTGGPAPARALCWNLPGPVVFRGLLLRLCLPGRPAAGAAPLTKAPQASNRLLRAGTDPPTLISAAVNLGRALD